jgi:arylsulfatase A-like enzyme
MFMQEAGYKTGIFGKWGLANHDQPGTPNQKGFDAFFGYLNQRHAHCYYPEFLYENNQRIYYPENGTHFLHDNYSKISAYSSKGSVIPPGITDPSNAKNAFDQYSAKSLDFVRANHQAPFFLYLAYTLPHGPLISPTLGTYHDKNWALPYKEWAAMVTHMDAAVGELMQLLKELKIDQNTLIIFASDNGDSSHGYEARYRDENAEINIADFFQSSSPTRGQKGGTFDGSFHVPALAWWPNRIEAGSSSDHLWAFWDVLPTLADVVGKKLPVQTDGLSFKPTLLNIGRQEKHPYLYWEFNQVQVIRSDRWLARRPSGEDIELYDLTANPEQIQDISSQHPQVVAKMGTYMSASHLPSDVWPSPGESEEQFAQRLQTTGIPERPNNIANF